MCFRTPQVGPGNRAPILPVARAGCTSVNNVRIREGDKEVKSMSRDPHGSSYVLRVPTKCSLPANESRLNRPESGQFLYPRNQPGHSDRSDNSEIDAFGPVRFSYDTTDAKRIYLSLGLRISDARKVEVGDVPEILINQAPSSPSHRRSYIPHR